MHTIRDDTRNCNHYAANKPVNYIPMLYTVEGSIADLLQLRMRFRDRTKHFSFSSSDREGSLDCGATKHIPIQALPQPPTVCSVLCIIHILLFLFQSFNDICVCLPSHMCLVIMQLSKESESPENWLSVELVIRSPLLQQEMSTVLAKALLHIHTIMHVRAISPCLHLEIVEYLCTSWLMQTDATLHLNKL